MPDFPVRAVAYSPDGTRLATGNDDGTVRIWNPAAGTTLATLTGHIGSVRAVAYSPAGTCLASTGNDGSVRITSITSAMNRPTRRWPWQRRRTLPVGKALRTELCGPAAALAFPRMGRRSRVDTRPVAQW